MNKRIQALLFTAVWLLAFPLQAQYRAEMQRGEKEMELGAFHLAIESFKRALVYRPEEYDALWRIAEAYHLINELDTARIYYSQAMKDRRVSASTLLGYAHTLRGLGMYEGAQLLYQAYAREEDSEIGNHFITSVTFAQSQREETAGFAAKQLSINTEASEFGASVPQDGKLLFNSGRIDPEFAGLSINRPWVVEVAADGILDEPAMLSMGYVPTDGSQIGPVRYSPDGRQVVFTRNNFIAGTRPIPEAGPTLSLLIADVNEAGMWSNVRPLPFNGSDYSTGYGTFGTDGATIYFASNRPGGFGGYDIYRARFEKGEWQTIPENLGPVVNSRGHEITPFYNGHSLFFSSSWHHGLGGYDVFRAQMATGKPITLYHLGNAVNSSRDDMGFVFDRNTRTGYVTSNRIGFSGGLEDIYYIMPEEDLPALADRVDEGTDLSVSGPAAPTQNGVLPVKPPALTTMRGYLNDITNGEPVIDADVMVIKKSTGQEASTWSDSYGAFYASVEPFTDYEVTVQAPGYESIVFDVVTEDSDQTEVFGTTELSPRTAAEVVEAGRPRGTFGVQIASLLVEPALGDYANVAALGDLVVEQEENRRRVQLGYYATRREAQQVAQQVRQLGYAGSFVVEFLPGSTEPGLVSDPESAPAEYTSAPPPAEPVATSKSTAPQPGYRVQLGAFSRPQNFDRAKAGQLGTLGSEARGNLTVFYIDDIITLEAARYTRDKAESLGYVGAYVLEWTEQGYTKR